MSSVSRWKRHEEATAVPASPVHTNLAQCLIGCDSSRSREVQGTQFIVCMRNLHALVRCQFGVQPAGSACLLITEDEAVTISIVYIPESFGRMGGEQPQPGWPHAAGFEGRPVCVMVHIE